LSNTLSASDRQCIIRARWYLAQVDALLAALKAKLRLDEDERIQCQSMLRELKNRFGIDKTTPLAEREATPPLVHYHARMLEAQARLTMPTNTPPTPGRWVGPLEACRTHLVEYLAYMEQREPGHVRVGR
jgi:hypothetical protein